MAKMKHMLKCLYYTFQANKRSLRKILVIAHFEKWEEMQMYEDEEKKTKSIR